MSALSDYPKPYPLQFEGSGLAKRVLSLLGWTVVFAGLPAKQGVLIVYPHTSNWDFVMAILAKWSLGLPVMFWGKDKLFRIPLFGRWLAWLGGVPVERTAARGVTAQALSLFAQHRQGGSYFWLGLAPEGTRKCLPGLRSGFYRTALGAGVPLGLVRLDYARREVRALDFIALTGNEAADMARIAGVLAGTPGRHPANASPLKLLDASIDRTETIVK